MNSSHLKQLLFNHFDGRSTPLQIEILKKWLTTPENHELYYQYLQEWEHLNPQIVTDSSSAYYKFLEKREKPLSAIVEQKGRSNRLLRINSRVSAAVVAAIFVASIFLTHSYWNRKTVEAAAGEKLTLQLPDDSRLVIHEKSSVVVPRFYFLPFHRNVKLLWGEVEFSVVRRNDNRVFTVTLADSLRIRVLGTQFSVRQDRRLTHVKLEEGKIAFDYPDEGRGGELLLSPGEQIVYWHTNARIQKIVPTGVVEEKEKEWVLGGVLLHELAKKIEQEFKVKIRIENPTHEALVVNGIVPIDNLDLLLASVAATLDLEIKRNGTTIQIR